MALFSDGQEVKSLVWGDSEYPVTQGFGEYNESTAGMYAYSADYGWPAGTHIGMDVGVPKFTPIYAAEPGTVIRAGPSDSFRPNPVWVRQTDGDVAIYGHLWSDSVVEGQSVQRGQQLGVSGEQTVMGTMTPDGTGPHIHFELRQPIQGEADNEGITGYTAIDPGYELIETKPGDHLIGDSGSTHNGNENQFGYSFGIQSLGPGTKRLGFAILGIGLLIVGVVALVGPERIKQGAKLAAVV